MLAAFVFNSDPAVVSVFHNDVFHDAFEVEFGVAALAGVFGHEFARSGFPAVGLGADSFGKRHKQINPLVGIEFFASLVVDGEVSEVGQGADPLVAGGFHDLGEPVAVRREPAVVFHEDVEPALFALVTKPRQSIGGQAHLFFPGARAGGVDPD